MAPSATRILFAYGLFLMVGGITAFAMANFEAKAKTAVIMGQCRRTRQREGAASDERVAETGTGPEGGGVGLNNTSLLVVRCICAHSLSLLCLSSSQASAAV